MHPSPSLNKSLYLVIIAGGSGTRFWPKSTSQRPKQLLSFGKPTKNSGSLLAQTLARFDKLVPNSQKLIVTTSLLVQPIESEKLNATVLAEPQGRNTSPCIYWAAQWVLNKDPEGIMLVMPADHFIANPQAFAATVQNGVNWVMKQDDLVTLGIEPSRPETGYGYLKVGETVQQDEAAGPFLLPPRKVDAFVEKPNLEKAKEFVQSGNYLWNGGMFIWKAKTILASFDEHMPEMKRAWEESEGKVELAYPKMTATSIDYGIMEKAKNVVAFPLNCGWDDLGSWISLETLAEQLHIQHEGNSVNHGEVLSIDSTGNIVDVSAKKLVALLGVNDLIIAEQGDALLIADKSRAQEIRTIVDAVKKVRPELI